MRQKEAAPHASGNSRRRGRWARALDRYGVDAVSVVATVGAAACVLTALYCMGALTRGWRSETFIQLLVHGASGALLVLLARERAQSRHAFAEVRRKLQASDEALRATLDSGHNRLQQALEASRRGEAFLKTLVDAMPYPVWVKDDRHRWVLVNDAFVRWVKLPREALIGRSDADVYPAELAARAQQEDACALASGTAVVVEEDESVDSQDQMRHWLKTKFAFTGIDGVRCVAGFATDITRIKQVEQSLREGEARFLRFTQLSSDWFWEQDENYRFTFLSAGLIRRGIDPRDYLGKTRWEASAAPEDDPDWRRHREALAARRPYYNLRFLAPTVTGATRLISVNGEPVFDADNQFKGYRGVARDLTDVFLAERAQKGSEERLRGVLEAAMDGIVITDEQGMVLAVNPALCSIFGYASADLLQGKIDVLIPVRLRQAYQSAFMRDGASAPGEFIGTALRLEARRRDGSEFPVEVCIAESRLEGGRQYTASVRDLSQRRPTCQNCDALRHEARAGVYASE